MPEFINSPTFLIVAAIFGVLLLMGFLKGGIRLIIWIVILAGILMGLGFLTQGDLRDWIEKLIKIVP